MSLAYIKDILYKEVYKCSMKYLSKRLICYEKEIYTRFTIRDLKKVLEKKKSLIHEVCLIIRE